MGKNFLVGIYHVLKKRVDAFFGVATVPEETVEKGKLNEWLITTKKHKERKSK